MNKRPVVLCILDGWGDEKNKEYNAPKIANTPNFDKLLIVISCLVPTFNIGNLLLNFS